MNRQCFVLELSHPGDGQIKRIHVSYKSLLYILGAFLVLGVAAFGACSSYVRMFWKVSHYNQLRADFDRLRGRYQNLQQVSKQHTVQIASLESLASEVSQAYGIRQPSTSNLPMDDDDSTATNVKESIEEFNFLKAAGYSRIYHRYAHQWQTHMQPNLWPVLGILKSSFGGRSDPFSGEGAFHTGIDLAVPSGTPVHATADGVVLSAGWSGGYGKVVVIDHGNGIETYYAHLSQFIVVPGQEVTSNQTIAMTGGTGHVTGPHLHYEVRVAGTPVNPMKYLGMGTIRKTQLASTGKMRHSDLGL
ncbi:MAG TPA: M23 family metallopeptidase [Bryobacteraceae bacterium]|nr:M23 family metallopeptidase [Bryobacteraceae bacterium]